jgi:malonyl-CoA decarboxylase
VLCTTSRALVAVSSEAASTALAEQVGRRYRLLDPELRSRYLAFLATELGPDPAAVKAAVEAWQAQPTEDALWGVSCAVEAPRQALIRALNTAPRGIQMVLDLRGDVQGRLAEHPELLPLERDLHHVLSSWFNRGFIRLRRISWESPAEVLEKIIAYEAVHEIRGWDDLRRRLEPDRRCYGFFHPALRNEPLIFVEVALTAGMVSSIGEVLDAPSLDGQRAGLFDPPGEAGPVDTATFYSITSCQPGLAGVPLGDFLIKQVAVDLARELPALRHFVTLSPLPGFRAWLDRMRRRRRHLGPDRAALLARLDEAGWAGRPDAGEVRPLLERLCARYLVEAEKGRGALDPVARFHLRNGARVLRINWLADPSDRGIRQSAGLMVTFEYDDRAVAANHEAYVNDGSVARSDAIDRLLADDIYESAG